MNNNEKYSVLIVDDEAAYIDVLRDIGSGLCSKTSDKREAGHQEGGKV